MSSTKDLASRVEALESHIAHQDQTIEDLNKAITEQWAQFEKLQRDISKLHAELEQIESSGGAGEADERPPHY
ncbi:SlyX family protein [Maritalea porphyrae]|uniref:SlyX family protein n=1 Tax=Maritalea porphyrae TaxID=880732 RepID=UPI0022AF2E14|nr:SlyX family protein [Maritalea porphyrae]MCZ4273655.1 SlyX family protein [Maritalea porphyrae]